MKNDTINNTRIVWLLDELKHNYCDDKLSTFYYYEYMSLLMDICTDVITKSKIKRMISEIEQMHPDEIKKVIG
ncbi:MAG: hypothetical protein EHM34_04920 [Nitrosopumilales archaeon]|nr:MAG: hypothetical protein EHM34_04920 [Nitrosopumilales archaeon]